MPFHLTDKERSRLRGMVKRPRSRKQEHRAAALLALDEGQPVETVARQCRVGIDRVESWVERFQKLRIAFLEEPSAGRPDPLPGGGHVEGDEEEEDWRP